ncbi:MAG TPA: efflux RND transporter periplasmic adaptor subunit [Polyangia bacterium]
MRRELVLVALALALGACRRGGEPEARRPSKTVTCAPVEKKAIRDTIEVRGTTAPLPDRDVLVAPQVSGRLLRVAVREGDQVASGQVVARVDPAPLADAARQADATLAKAQAERQNAQTTLARVARVFERGIAARQEVDDAAAKEAAARAAVADAQAAARQAHRQLARAVVRSPLQGVVLKVLRKPGELVDGTPATAVVEIGDTTVLELVADVPGPDLVRLRRGVTATITFPAMPRQQLVGTVSMVAPALDRATGVGAVRITLQPAPAAAPPVGLYGTARVESGAPHEVLLVPAAAVRSVVGEDGEVVVCGADRVAHVRRVQVGPAQGGATVVRGPLAPPERVAVAPVLGLAEGDAIEVAP